MVFIDIVAVTLLMHSSGGVTSGLGMLLLVSIIAFVISVVVFGICVWVMNSTLGTTCAISSISQQAKNLKVILYVVRIT